MNPADRPPPFEVDLVDEAPSGLTTAYLVFFERREGYRVTEAERIATLLLANDPVRNGTLMSEGLYRLVVSPLVLHYEIYPLSRVVRVTSVGYYPV